MNIEPKVQPQPIAAASGPGKLSRFFPILGWLPGYNRKWLRTDLIAGITVTALLVPEGMAYAELAGMPPETIFYAAPAALLLYAIFGTSRQLVVVVSSVQAVMSYSIVSALAPPDTPEFYVLTTALAIAAGVVAVLAGILRLGRVAQFFSSSVLAGFVSGLAVVIAVKQLPKMFGIEAGSGNVWQRLYDLLINLPETHILTLAVGISSLVLMLALERYFHRIPAALVAMVYGIVISTVFDLHELGVHVVGEIPAGLAPPALPGITVEQWLSLLPGALALSLVVFAEAIGPARSFATKYRYSINPDQELIGLGMANIGTGLFQGFPIGSSLSKSAANDAAGAKSQMSGILAAGLTILVALFLTPLFTDLPEATLAAIVVVAIAGMFKWREMLRLYRLRRLDFALALITFLGVLTFHEALWALLLAVVLSLLALVWRTSQGRMTELGLSPGRLTFEEVKPGSEASPVSSLLIFAPEESLFFANADTVRVQITNRLAASAEPIQGVLLDLELTNELDVPSADMLRELDDDLDAAGVQLMLARARPVVRDLLDRSGVTEAVGAEHFYGRVLEGVLVHLSRGDTYTRRFVGLSGDVLRRLQQVTGEMLGQAEGERRAQLESLHAQLGEAIDETGATGSERASLLR
jgi:high affinity sulfate transporter 1